MDEFTEYIEYTIAKQLPHKIVFSEEKHVHFWREYLEHPTSLQNFLGKNIQIENFKIYIQNHRAGALPVIFIPNRIDFENFLIAYYPKLTKIPLSTNAFFIKNALNEHRLQEKKKLYYATIPWDMEYKKICFLEPWTIRDTFILLTDAPYSNVHLLEDSWIEKSFKIRLEHEFTHYWIQRLFAPKKTTCLEEILCDWAGCIAVWNQYNANYALQFLGIDDSQEETSRFFFYTRSLSRQTQQYYKSLIQDSLNHLQQLTEQYYTKENFERFFLTLALFSIKMLSSYLYESYFLKFWEESNNIKKIFT